MTSSRPVAGSPPPRAARRRALALFAVAGVLALGGCGFHLRGSTNLHFSSVYVAGSDGSPFVIALKRQILSTTSTRVVASSKDAQVVFSLLSETQSQEPMAYNADGTVAQYQLRYAVRFQLATPGGLMIIAPHELAQTSNLSYSSGATLAKANESDLLYRGMRRELVDRVMDQLAAARLP